MTTMTTTTTTTTTILLILCLGCLVFGVHGLNSNRIMPWMCLERCGGNATTITENLLQLANYSSIVTAVSFERYNLGPNSTLVSDLGNLTDVHAYLSYLGFQTIPMISSYPYPPAFLSWMREVFSNPAPFISSLLSEAKRWDYAGYCIDWEPTTTPEPQDAINYANFLQQVSQELHANGLMVTIAFGSWSPIWNWTLLAQTDIDRFNLMETYVGNQTIFTTALEKAVATFPLGKLGVGLETINDDVKGNPPFTIQELQYRFDLINKNNIQEIDIWDTPVPSNWWPFLQSFRGIE